MFTRKSRKSILVAKIFPYFPQKPEAGDGSNVRNPLYFRICLDCQIFFFFYQSPLKRIVKHNLPNTISRSFVTSLKFSGEAHQPLEKRDTVERIYYFHVDNNKDLKKHANIFTDI